MKQTIKRTVTHYHGLPDTKDYAVLKKDRNGNVCIWDWLPSKADALEESDNLTSEEVAEMHRNLNDAPMLDNNEAGKSFAIVS